MKVRTLFEQKKPVIALEISPRPDVPMETIYESLQQYELIHPDYISVTYGAGGSQRGRTVEIASQIRKHHHIESMAHFTCVGHSKEEVGHLLDSLKQQGLENILALRGDPPVDQPDFDYSQNAFPYASDLIRHIRAREGDVFCLSAAAYLEGHPQSKSLKQDLLSLKNKVSQGVDFLVTQLFFDNRLYFDFIDKAASVGIDCPIIPGIMPLFRADRIKSMTAKSGCSIPAKLVLLMDQYADSPEDLKKAGIEYAAGQIRDLVEQGACGIHLYTMNLPKTSRIILQMAGVIE